MSGNNRPRRRLKTLVVQCSTAVLMTVTSVLLSWCMSTGRWMAAVLCALGYLAGLALVVEIDRRFG